MSAVPEPLETPRLCTRLAYSGTEEYSSCAESVRRKYRDRYGAVVDPRPDVFVAVVDGGQDSPLYGVAGLTCASGRRLLSEHYLDAPVEDICTELFGGSPCRTRIVEMGSVSSFYPGTGLFLMRTLPAVARRLGFDFLLATLTGELHRLAKLAEWDFRTITNARRADLTGVRTDWGTYYAAKPRTGILRCATTDQGVR